MLLELESSSQALAWVLDYLRALRRGRLRPYSFCERKARAATRGSVPWGPTGEQLRELAAASYEPANLAPIFAVLSSRLRAPPPAWRKTYKALLVLEWLATRGSPAAATRANGMRFVLEELRSYRCDDPASGNDVGANIRHRAAAILALLSDSEQLATLRDAQTKTYWAVSSAVPARPTYDDLRPGRDSSASPPRPAAARAPGDSKGLTPEAAARARALLERAARADGNRSCADCGDSPAGWASASCGVFLCQQCAGVHRGLGVHVSVVRSLTLDAWTPAQAAFMAATGNAVANAHWEARLPPGFQRPSPQQVDGRRPPELEALIRRKYSGAFAREGATWPPPQAGAALGGLKPSEQQHAPPPLPPRKPLPTLPEAAPPPPPPSVAPMISFFEDDAVAGAPPLPPPPLPPPQAHPPPSFAHAPELLPPSPASEAPPASLFGPPRAAPPSLAAASVALPDSVAALLSPPPASRPTLQPPGSAALPPLPPRVLGGPHAPALPPRPVVAPRPAAPPSADPFAALAPIAVAPAPPPTPMRPLLRAAPPAPAAHDAFADLGALR